MEQIPIIDRFVEEVRMKNAVELAKFLIQFTEKQRSQVLENAMHLIAAEEAVPGILERLEKS